MQTEKDLARIDIIRGGNDDDYDSEEDREIAVQKVIASVDMKGLEAFLDRIYPKVSRILEANLG